MRLEDGVFSGKKRNELRMNVRLLQGFNGKGKPWGRMRKEKAGQ